MVTIPLWFEPLLALLGYTIADLPVTEGLGSFRALRLIHEDLTPNGYEKRVTRLIFLFRELPAEIDPELRQEMDLVLSREQLRDSLLSDGLRWSTRRFKSDLPLKVRDLEWIVDEPVEFVDFLRETGEGI